MMRAERSKLLIHELLNSEDASPSGFRVVLDGNLSALAALWEQADSHHDRWPEISAALAEMFDGEQSLAYLAVATWMAQVSDDHTVAINHLRCLLNIKSPLHAGYWGIESSTYSLLSIGLARSPLVADMVVRVLVRNCKALPLSSEHCRTLTEAARIYAATISDTDISDYYLKRLVETRVSATPQDADEPLTGRIVNRLASRLLGCSSPHGDNRWLGHFGRVFSTQHVEAIAQTISLRESPRSDVIPLDVASRVLDTWTSLFRARVQIADADVDFGSAAFAGGSLIASVTLESNEGAVPLQSAFAELRNLKPLSCGQEWREFAVAVAASNLAVSVDQLTATISGTMAKVTSQTMEISKRQAEDIADAVDALVLPLSSSDVPQADELRRVFAIANLRSVDLDPDSELLGVTSRQVNYYIQAARILGLVDGHRNITAAGRQCVRLDDVDKYTFASMLFEATEAGSRWIQWSKGRTLLDVDPNTAEAFLVETVKDLSRNTVGRRSRTLARWCVELKQRHYALHKVRVL